MLRRDRVVDARLGDSNVSPAFDFGDPTAGKVMLPAPDADDDFSCFLVVASAGVLTVCDNPAALVELEDFAVGTRMGDGNTLPRLLSTPFERLLVATGVKALLLPVLPSR